YEMKNINYKTNSFELEEESKLVLEGFIEFLRENNSFNIAISGHTDDVGDDAYNLKLSENRAKAVYDYLIGNGVYAYRLTYQGFGETKPVLPNTSEENRKRNRRTEFVVTRK
ncbi:MAG: OmpA family protein, partial [Bacteroidota bacterium]